MKNKLKSLRARDSYYSEDYEDDTDEMNEIKDFFCVTLNNMSREDAKLYGKTYGLFIRPNRKGYDLAGSEDQVRAMLEDYVGRYDEIGRIMNEGWYVPDWNRDGFVNPHKRYVDSKKDLKHYQITYTYEGQKDTFETYAEDEKQAIKDLKKGYDEEELKVVSVKVLDKNIIKDFKDSDPWHELVHYLITFEDGHKETDTLPVYVRDQCSSDEEIIDMLQDYYDDKIVAVKQVGWSRMGDSKKKVKDSYEGNLEALAEYLEWEGIIGYNSDIEEIYETNEALIDDEWETFENPYDALDAYLTWEGILGYTDAIYDILENGVESVYYDAMLTEKEKSEEYTYEDFERDLNHLGIKGHTSTLFKEASRGLNNLKRVQKISGGWWNDVDVEQVYKLYKKVKEED